MGRRWRVLALIALLLAAHVPASARASELTVATLNCESGGADPYRVAEAFEEIRDCDIWGLQEVQSRTWARIFRDQAERVRGERFTYLLGSTGWSKKLCVVFNSDRLELRRYFELEDINPDGRFRAPLVADMKDRRSGRTFYFVVNHLARSPSWARHRQARALNEWASRRRKPVICVGDFNFDWDPRRGDWDHDRGYDYLVEDGVFEWTRPERLVRTQCSRYGNVLDFIFVAKGARRWRGESEIVIVHRCPDTDRTSDHQAVKATFQLPDD